MVLTTFSLILPLPETPTHLTVWRTLEVGNILRGKHNKKVSWPGNNRMDSLLPLDTQETGRGSVIFKGESELHPKVADSFWLAVAQRIKHSVNHKAPRYEIRRIYLGPVVPFPKEKIHPEVLLTSQPGRQIPYGLLKCIRVHHSLPVTGDS